MGRTSNRKLFEHLIYLLRTLHGIFIMKITLIILSITIIAIQAVPVPKKEDVDQFTAYPRRHARDLTYEKLAKQSSVKNDFTDLTETAGGPRKIDQSEGRRFKRSPLVELTSEFTAYPRRHARDLNDEKLAKQSSVKDDFDLDQAEADPRKIDQSEGLRYKRSPPLVEMDSELLAKHISGSDYFDLGEEDYGYARVNSKKD